MVTESDPWTVHHYSMFWLALTIIAPESDPRALLITFLTKLRFVIMFDVIFYVTRGMQDTSQLKLR